jgi:hypothetical protein
MPDGTLAIDNRLQIRNMAFLILENTKHIDYDADWVKDLAMQIENLAVDDRMFGVYQVRLTPQGNEVS